LGEKTVKGAGQTGKEAGDKVNGEFVNPRIVSKVLRPDGILFNGLEGLTEGRACNSANHQGAEGEEDENKIVKDDGVLHVDSEKRRPGNPFETGLAARDFIPAPADKVKDLRKGNGEHGKIDPFFIPNDISQKTGKEGADDCPQENGNKETALLKHMEKRQGSSIRSDPIKRSMAKRGQPRIAQAEIETQGEDEPDQQLCPEGYEFAEIRIKGIQKKNKKDPEIGIPENLLH
jgi:hypothetical protein